MFHSQGVLLELQLDRRPSFVQDRIYQTLSNYFLDQYALHPSQFPWLYSTTPRVSDGSHPSVMMGSDLSLPPLIERPWGGSCPPSRWVSSTSVPPRIGEGLYIWFRPSLGLLMGPEKEKTGLKDVRGDSARRTPSGSRRVSSFLSHLLPRPSPTLLPFLGRVGDFGEQQTGNTVGHFDSRREGIGQGEKVGVVSCQTNPSIC